MGGLSDPPKNVSSKSFSSLIKWEFGKEIKQNVFWCSKFQLWNQFKTRFTIWNSVLFIVKLCVHFVSVCLCVKKVSILCLVSVCLKVKNGHRLTLKSLFTHHPPENFFWSHMKGMAKIRLFYSGDMALILPR